MKATLKEKLLAHAIKKHQSVIDDFNTRLKDLNEGMRRVSEQSPGGRQPGQTVQMDAELAAIQEQLLFANEEMRILNDLDTSPCDTAETGALVVTDKGSFFVSTSIEQFEADGKDYYGLSTRSPLFREMSGKKKGDTFSFNDTSYVILDIF